LRWDKISIFFEREKKSFGHVSGRNHDKARKRKKKKKKKIIISEGDMLEILLQ
jgi:hypothetical protein